MENSHNIIVKKVLVYNVIETADTSCNMKEAIEVNALEINKIVIGIGFRPNSKEEITEVIIISVVVDILEQNYFLPRNILKKENASVANIGEENRDLLLREEKVIVSKDIVKNISWD